MSEFSVALIINIKKFNAESDKSTVEIPKAFYD